MLDTNRNIFVVDTSVLLDYPGIVPDAEGNTKAFDNPLVDMTGAHVVIPETVLRELKKFAGADETDPRQYTARELIRNIDHLCENYDPCGMNANYMLSAALPLPDGRQLSVLPVHADFASGLPFRPAPDDMDGQILLAALACMHLVHHVHERDAGSRWGPEFHWKDSSTRLNYTTDKVTLLTNDYEQAIRAHTLGIRTSRYSYTLSPPYTGRREVTVPVELFIAFWNDHKIERELWETYFPQEDQLVANEFIAMRPGESADVKPPLEYIVHDDRYYRHIGRYDAEEDAIVGLKYLTEAPFTPMSDGQAMYAEALMHPEIDAVICTGPAGSGKTYLPTIYGVDACQKGKYKTISVVPCKDNGKLGALPGGLNEKMALDVGPIRNALENYYYENDPHFKRELERLERNGARIIYSEHEDEGTEMSLDDKIQAHINYVWKRFFRNVPVEKAQGLDFRKKLVLYDEFQDQSPARADMLVKRLGKDGKIVITGDIKQIHSPHRDENNNGIVYATGLLYDLPMVARVSLLKDEVERHELVRLIAERQAAKPANRWDHEDAKTIRK